MSTATIEATYKLENGILWGLNSAGNMYRILFHPTPGCTDLKQAITEYEDWSMYNE